MTNITKKLFIIFFIIISSANPAFSKKNNLIAIGNENAKITIKVFSSLTCPHCANFHNKIYDKLKDEFIDSGKVRFEHYGFPFEVLTYDKNRNFLDPQFEKTIILDHSGLNPLFEKQIELIKDLK